MRWDCLSEIHIMIRIDIMVCIVGDMQSRNKLGRHIGHGLGGVVEGLLLLVLVGYHILVHTCNYIFGMP